MGLRSTIEEAMKDALRQQKKLRLAALRLVWSQIKKEEIDQQRKELTDSQIIESLGKMVKQRKDSIRQFVKAERSDLVEIEQKELAIINEFLPEPFSKTEVATIITTAIAQSGATSMKDMGKVMALVKAQVQGRADMNQVSQSVKQLLS